MTKLGRKKIQYDESVAQVVLGMSQFGAPLKDIATFVQISIPVLRKLYEKELERGRILANGEVAKTLFNKAVKDKDTTALIFWCKTRMGWRETQKVDLTSSDGSVSPSPAFDFSLLSPEQIAALRGKLDACNKEGQSDTAVTD